MTADGERGFPAHVIDAAFGRDALAATHRRAAEQQPRWLAGLIAKHGQPVTYQPEPITLGASRFQTWAWVGFGVQVEQTLSTWTVSAHRRGHLAKLAGLERYPTDAEISGVVALAGLDDAPAPVPGSSRRAPEPDGRPVRATAIRSVLYDALSPNFEIDSDGYDDAAVAVAKLIDAAAAQGYAEAIARLRDDDRYRDWWTSGGVKPDNPIRRHLADYLETVGPDGVDVTTGRWPAREHAVIRAAIAWRRMRIGKPTKPNSESAALIEAVEELPHIGDDARSGAS